MGRPTADDPLREVPISRTTVFSGRLITVHRDRVRLPAGHETDREVVEHPGAVAVVAEAEPGRLVMVRQWRHAVGRALWEIPAGTREPGEAPQRTAERELAEETGFAASGWSCLGSFPLAPGYSGELMSLYLATDLTPGLPAAAGDENLEVGIFDRRAVAELVEAGSVDVKTLAGLALAGRLGRAAGD